MTTLEKIILKSWIVKTSVFLLALIAIVSYTLLSFFGSEVYSGKIQPLLGEIFVAILLFQYLMHKKCFYSWGAIFMLMILNIVNIIFIITDITPGIYFKIGMFCCYSTALILAIIYTFTDTNKEKTQLSNFVKKIGGGVAIGKKPTHIREVFNDYIIFVDVTNESNNLYTCEVYKSNSEILLLNQSIYNNYEEYISDIQNQISNL